MGEMDEVVVEFLQEATEGLDQIDRDLVELEAHPESMENIRSVFRTMHTIKGTCGFLGFGTLESVAHAAENLLVLIRDGELPITEVIISAILSSIDAVRAQLTGIEETGEDPANNYDELLHRLHELQTGGSVASEEMSSVEMSSEAFSLFVTSAQELTNGVDAAPVFQVDPLVSTHIDEQLEAEPFDQSEPVDLPHQLVGQILVDTNVVTPGDRFLALQEQAFGDDRRLGEILVEHGATTPEQIEEAISSEHVAKKSGSSESTIRVDVGVLDTLMNLIGELVLTRHQIVRLAGTSSDKSFIGPAQRLSAITSELQDEVMRARMQPIGNAWSKIPRVVRDLAKACSKKVVVATEGEDSELDKTILEAIKDPLTHLVRNAVDHGIETPEQRIAAGKPAEGTLTMRAYHESGLVIIEISDDGAGIDANKIRAKVVQKGLMTESEAWATADKEILDCIFMAGFSTAEQTTTVSGRGVGMDVVKSKIESIRGTVELVTTVGRGTTFVIRIPLTLAIVPALMVRDGDQHYAIEQTNLVELVRIEKATMQKDIEFVHSVPVHRLRGRLLELIELGRVFGRETPPLFERSSIDIVVVKVDNREFGLVVDETEDTQDVVVKPLGGHFQAVPAFAGATIRADGGVALILDVRALGELAGARLDPTTAAANHDDGMNMSDSTASTLVVRIGDAQVALPLASVVRLEEFESSAIEFIRGAWRVQYRGELLPLIDGGYLDVGGPTAFSMGSQGERVSVVVCTNDTGVFGYVVDDIVDIIDWAPETEAQEAIVRGTATVVVNPTTMAISN